MVGVAPEIIDQAAAPADIGDVVGPVENGGERIAVGGELRRGEARHGPGILLLDPCERRLAADLFQPEIGIIVGGVDRRARIEIGHGVLSLSMSVVPPDGPGAAAKA